MKRIRLVVQLFAGICLAGALTAARPYDVGTTITVTTTQDTVVNNGNCSLREAIQAANTNLAVDACAGGVGSDTIAFSIGSGSQTITLGTTLHVTSVVHLDGRTQPGFNPATAVPIISINSTIEDLFYFETGSTGSSVRGLQLSVNAIAHAEESVLHIETNGMHVEGNYINTDGTSNTGGGDAVGVLIVSGDYNYIGDTGVAGRNLFGGGRFGVVVDNGTNNTIRYNYFGLRADGITIPTAFSSTNPGIVVCGGEPAARACTNTTIRGNIIGGFSTGILLGAAASFSTIAGNSIGVGSDGTTKIAGVTGVLVSGSHDNTIGGTTAADRNVISGHGSNIRIEDYAAYHPDDNVIQGNYIGTTADGVYRVVPYVPGGGGYFGVYINGGDGNLVGGTVPGSSNVISGNQTGVRIDSTATNTMVRGNFIGPTVTGATALIQGAGIYLATGATANIGDGSTPGGNLISGNAQGIRIIASTGTTIYGNRIGLAARGDFPVPNVDGITLQGASQAAIAQNWIAHNDTMGVSIEAAATVAAGSNGNCFSDNGNNAVFSLNSGASAPLTDNWWGNPTGPTHPGNLGGTGDHVTNYVNYSNWLTHPPPACPRALSDYNGDGHTDPVVFEKATGHWFTVASHFGFMTPALGFGNDTSYIPVPADYDGDGKADPAVFERLTGNWFVIGSTDGFFTPALGFGSDASYIPVPGDYDGDGKTDAAVFERATGNWFVVGSKLGFFTPALGFGNDTSYIPVPGDYDDDGKTDAAVFEKATGNWFVVGSTLGFFTPALGFGNSTGYIAVQGDYDGDGKTDPAVFEKASGNWFVVGSTSGFFTPALGFGNDASYIPQPGDYDGDAQADPAVFEKASGNWFVVGSTSGFFTPALGFGNATLYIPVVTR